MIAITILKGFADMTQNERRSHSRTKINYPISYVCLGKTGHVIDEKMGVILDIGQGGALIESQHKIVSDYILLISVDLSCNLIEIRGKVVHCRIGKNGRYRTGISFQGTDEKNLYFAKRLMMAYYYHEKVYEDDGPSRTLQSVI